MYDGDYIERLLLFEKPLTSRFRKKYVEFLALEILQYCYGEVRDENDYLAFSCHGDNGYPVQVFTDGKMIEGTWSRFSDNDPAIYVDNKGENIKLTPGKTWICIIWMEYADDVILN